MSDTTLSTLSARRVWDSRGNPTVEVEATLADGSTGRAMAPAGASRGTREAIDLRDGGSRLGGMDVRNAVGNVNRLIARELRGMDASRQADIDSRLIELDATPYKSSLGGNAIVATSMAVMHAAASSAGKPLWRYIADFTGQTPTLPLPEIQIFGGGAHAGRRVDVQDFMIMVPGASSFDEVLEVTSEVYRAAGARMKAKGGNLGVADEGGWWPVFDSNEEALETLTRAIEDTGEKPGERVVISLDIAASEFGSQGRYRLALEDRELDREQMIELLGRWIDDYPIASIEDPLAEDDPEGVIDFTRQYGHRIQIIGDDYLVTNADLVHQAADQGACNAVLVKVNQSGTVTESLACLAAARDHGYRGIVSARSGETEDVTICHLAVGLDAGQLKVGSITRSERMAKWNECLRIGEQLGDNAYVMGKPLANTWWARQQEENAR
ncbi:phosphopyruvate hydratase [Granulosicoccus sp. 3-233]|uniref:phosphopyruvate hydratase n=1 Tax=Granulosicoccus sp. 3-233 TaxID=3417969 RepID=UPI003D34EB6D